MSERAIPDAHAPTLKSVPGHVETYFVTLNLVRLVPHNGHRRSEGPLSARKQTPTGDAWKVSS